MDPIPSRFFRFLSTNCSTNRFSNLQTSLLPLISSRWRGKSFEESSRISRISSFYLDICLSHIRFDWTEKNGRIEKEKERKEGKGKRKLVAGAYNRGDLIQDRGDLINIEEILRGLGSDYSFEEIFRGGLGRAPTFPLKAERWKKRPWEGGGERKKEAEGAGWRKE